MPITIGGNFDESSVDSYPALLDFLREQEFADKIAKINFKPIIKAPAPETPKGFIPLTVVGDSDKPLNGTCMTSAGAGSPKGSSVCDSCHFVDEKMSFLREETRKRGFPTPDGVHMGPCEIHRRHAYTIGPDGSLYACPGFTGDEDRVDRAHRRPRRDLAAGGGRALRASQPAQGRVRRLFLHSRVRRRLFRGRAHRAW